MPHIRPLINDMSVFNLTHGGQAHCHYNCAVTGQFSISPSTVNFLKNLKKKKKSVEGFLDAYTLKAL